MIRRTESFMIDAHTFHSYELVIEWWYKSENGGKKGEEFIYFVSLAMIFRKRSLRISFIKTIGSSDPDF